MQGESNSVARPLLAEAKDGREAEAIFQIPGAKQICVLNIEIGTFLLVVVIVLIFVY